MQCGHLSGKEVQKGGDICVCMADSFFCTVKIHHHKQPYFHKNEFFRSVD